ncbi:MAG: hypothetical protein BJ554DRAFT_3401, partial [Olpidium bornovanus]
TLAGNRARLPRRGNASSGAAVTRPPPREGAADLSLAGPSGNSSGTTTKHTRTGATMFFDTALPALTAEADGHGRMELEAEFCRNFVCCGVTLRDLHELLEHHEDMHSPGPVSGDPSLEAYYGVGPPAIPPSVDTPPQSPCFCEVDALLTTQFPGRAAAHNPALDDRPLFPVAELDSPTAETLTRTPVIDSGYASPGGGARSLCATEDEVLGEENRGAAKSYSAYFGRVVQSPAANAGAAAAAAARGMKRRLDRRNGRDESAALAASPSVNLYLVTEKLSVGNSAFPSASSGLSSPSPVATPPAELACEVFTAHRPTGWGATGRPRLTLYALRAGLGAAPAATRSSGRAPSSTAPDVFAWLVGLSTTSRIATSAVPRLRTGRELHHGLRRTRHRLETRRRETSR